MTALRLLRRPSPFAYPGGLPGFDPSHPAAQGMTPGHAFSGIANSGFINLLTRKAGTKVSTPAPAIIGSVGPSQLFSGGTQSFTFAGQSTKNDVSFTVAAIVQFTAVTTNTYFFSSSGAASTGFALGLSTVSLISLAFPGGGTGLSIASPTFTNGIPFFIAVSATQVGSNFIWNYAIVNLQSGQIFSGSGTTASTGPVAPNGTYMVGNTPAGFHPANGNLAATMFAPAFFSKAQLLQWAQDPWSFWYPRSLDLSMMLGGIAPSMPPYNPWPQAAPILAQ